MKYDIYYNRNIKNEDKKKIENKIKEIIQDDKIINLINLYKKKLIFTVGGDGTFLSSIQKYGYNCMYFPINGGTLGFYTSWNMDNINNIKNISPINLPLIEVEFNNIKYLCTNEITLINPLQTQILEIYINNRQFETFRGTGVCFSTPSGSTGYNKSLQGALINPENNLYQFTKIAPINNSKYRTIDNPIIFNEKDKILIKLEKDQEYNSIITIDRNNFELNCEEVQVSMSKKKLMILTNEIAFWDKIKKSFLKD